MKLTSKSSNSEIRKEAVIEQQTFNPRTPRSKTIFHLKIKSIPGFYCEPWEDKKPSSGQIGEVVRTWLAEHEKRVLGDD